MGCDSALSLAAHTHPCSITVYDSGGLHLRTAATKHGQLASCLR